MEQFLSFWQAWIFRDLQWVSQPVKLVSVVTCIWVLGCWKGRPIVRFWVECHQESWVVSSRVTHNRVWGGSVSGSKKERNHAWSDLLLRHTCCTTDVIDAVVPKTHWTVSMGISAWGVKVHSRDVKLHCLSPGRNARAWVESMSAPMYWTVLWAVTWTFVCLQQGQYSGASLNECTV